MAGQDGIFKIKGTLGGVTFYKSRDGYLVREKGGVSKSRIAKDPAFKRTRENGSEFGTAGKFGKFLRNSVRPLLQNSADKRVVSRLLKELLRIAKTDRLNMRGRRNAVQGNFEELRGFEFNSNGLLTNTLYVPYNATIERTTGLVELTLPDLIPTQMITAPQGTTHFKLVLGGAEVDFLVGNSIAAYASTAEIPWNETLLPAVTLQLNLTANSIMPLIQVFGIEFYQEINGAFYMLNNGAFNALALVNLNKV